MRSEKDSKMVNSCTSAVKPPAFFNSDQAIRITPMFGEDPRASGRYLEISSTIIPSKFRDVEIVVNVTVIDVKLDRCYWNRGIS